MAIINNRNIGDVRKGFAKYFPENPKSFEDGSFSSGDFNWKNREDFTKFVGREVKVYIDPITPQYTLVEAALKAFETRATYPEKPVEQNMPEDLKNLQEKAERERVEYQKTLDNAKKVTEEQIEALKKAQDIKGKIYARVEVPPQKPTPQADEVIEDFLTGNEASQHQHQSVEDLADLLEKQAGPALSDLPPEDIKNLCRKAAKDWVEVINNPALKAAYEEQAIQDAILAAAANDERVPEITRQAAGEMLVSRRAGIEGSREIINGVLGPEFAAKFGLSPSDINVALFTSPQARVTNILDFGKLNSGYGIFLQKHLAFINEAASFAGNPQLYLRGMLLRAIDDGISHLPADSLIRGLYGNSTVKNVFSFAAGRSVIITLNSSSWAGGIALRVPGGLKTVNAISGMYGVNFATAGKAAGGTVSAIGEVGKSVATKAAGDAITVGAEGAAGLGIAGAVTAATAPFLGPFAPVAGFIADLAVKIFGGEILKNITSRVSIFISKHKEDFIAALGVLAGGLIFRNVVGAASLGLLGYFGAKAFFGGTRGFGNALYRFGSGLGQIQLFKSILKAIAIVLIAIPILVVLVLFIINSGAYVVPPGESLLNSTNAYIEVDKIATPSSNLKSPQLITYTVTITAKQDPLTQVSLNYDCSAVKKGGQTIDCKGLEQIPASASATINPGSPYTFSFTSNYGSNYQDSLVTDDVTASATSVEGGKVSETGSASICFGKCPLDCFDFSDPSWSQQPTLKSLLQGAAGTLQSKYPNFAAKICAAGTAKLCYTTDAPPNCTGGAFATTYRPPASCSIKFNKCSEPYGQQGVLFLLTHEITHFIQFGKGGGHWQALFDDKVPQSEWPLCTYNRTNEDDESMAEGDALFVAKPIIDATGSCLTNYQTQYPYHYQFAKDCMFGASGNSDCAKLK